MQSLEVLTLIQLALGKASVAFMSQPGGGEIVMPTEELLETANDLCESIMSLARADRADLEAKLAEAETTIGSLKHFIGEQTDEIGLLQKALVWAATHEVSTGTLADGGRAVWYSDWGGGDRSVDFFRWDGTDASLIETLCKLAQEGEG